VVRASGCTITLLACFFYSLLPKKKPPGFPGPSKTAHNVTAVSTWRLSFDILIFMIRWFGVVLTSMNIMYTMDSIKSNFLIEFIKFYAKKEV
jgi:hypothetical protein